MIGETITIQRASTSEDRYGNDLPDWTDPDETTVDGVAFAPANVPGSPTETNTARTAVLENVTLYIPAGVDILPTDRVVARGATYEVVGKAKGWRNPFTGADQGIEVALREVVG